MTTEYQELLQAELESLRVRQNIRATSYREERYIRLSDRLGNKMVMLEVEEIAVGDYSPEYGHVDKVVVEEDYITLTFINGITITQPKGAELEIDQGGRFGKRGE